MVASATSQRRVQGAVVVGTALLVLRSQNYLVSYTSSRVTRTIRRKHWRHALGKVGLVVRLKGLGTTHEPSMLLLVRSPIEQVDACREIIGLASAHQEFK